MDKKMLVAVIGISAALLAATCVTASSWTFNTPLYTFRMEQASNKMNFLPTEMNTFTYITEKGHDLIYATGCSGCGDAEPLLPETCSTCSQHYCDEPTLCGTCGTCGTCWSTCPYTCDGDTCDETSCQNTCESTCPYTCMDWTCAGSTCGGWTCHATCQYTCYYYLTCQYTCYYYVTCGYTYTCIVC